MKAAVLFLIPMILAAFADPGLSQGFRSGGGRGPGGWAPTRSQGDVSRHHFRGTITSPGHRHATPHPLRRQGIVTRGVFLRTPHWGFAFAPAPFAHRFPPARFAPVRYYYPYYNSFYYPYYYPRYIGSLAFDVGGYGGSAPYAPYMPEAVYPKQSGSGDASSQLPGRRAGQIAPFDPTPPAIVERMLALAVVKSGDLIYDLGSGDGRVVIAAAKKFGARAVGFEIDAGLVKLARENAQREGVEHLVEFREQDFLTADLSPASVVALYLSYDGNLAVRPQLMQQLKPGARVVSYTFDMADWAPKIAEAYRDDSGNTHMLYLWQVGGSQAFSDAK